MKKLTSLFFTFSIAILLFGGGFRLGIYTERQNIVRPASQSPYNKNLNFTLFWDAWEKLQDKFVDKKKLNPRKMYFGAIRGMVASLDDPYTIFLTPEENRLAKDDLGGRFEGIGAQLGLKENRIVVIAPLKKSPAETAGIRAGDIITKVDDISTSKWTLFEAVSKIRGKKGTKVTLAIERSSNERQFTIVRQEIMVPSVELNYDKNTAILKLVRFGDDTNIEWDRTVEKLKTKWNNRELTGLILDLRDNPGGYLDGSVYIASEFLPRGATVVSQESAERKSIQYRVTRGGKLLDIPLVVLVNKGSASASEIVAGALRDHKRAQLVGEKTFGKGSIQEALDLKDGAGIHITVAKWILPKGDWINDKGVNPDIVLENPVDEANTITREDDHQLEKAIDLL